MERYSRLTDGVTGAAGSCSVWIAALDHKAFDHAVEDRIVIIPEIFDTFF